MWKMLGTQSMEPPDVSCAGTVEVMSAYNSGCIHFSDKTEILCAHFRYGIFLE